MASNRKPSTGLRKDGRSPGTRAGRSGKRQGMPRIMIAAGVLIVAGAVWLYWPAGESQPTGLGERRTIVSGEAAQAGSTGTAAPMSGDVDIDRQTQALTPEQPDQNAAQTQAADAAEAKEQAAAAAEPVKIEAEAETEPAPKPAAQQPKPATDEPPAPRIEPATSGAYAVQVASFGSAENADREVARLKAAGLQPLVRAGNNSAGEMVFRVWIAWFSSRQQAQQFIAQNQKEMPGAIPVHR